VTAGAATGCGIWATHFIAMLAYEPGVAVAYNVPMTAVSLLAAILITSAGLSLAANFEGRPMAAIGGAVLGAGVACMHYLGMWALEVPGHVSWALGLVTTSILLGMGFGMAALTLAARQDGRGRTIAAAVLLTLAISRHPIAGGGWVAVHEDITERRIDEEQRVVRAERESRRVSIESAIAEFRARVDEVLNAVVSDAGTMKSTAAALLTSSGETTHSVESALHNSQEASSSAGHVVSAVGELSSSINDISRQLESTAELVASAVGEAEDTNREIARLAEVVQSIDAVVRFIQNIARQTNLLALNATIEAARAGVAGRGFTVVASEVKALSVQTAKATEDIARQIGAVQSSATQSVEAVRKITTRMQEIGGYASQAAAFVRQQDGATLEISSNVATAADGAKAVLSVLRGVAQEALETSTSAKTVLAASARVQTSAAKLQEEVSGFLKKVGR